MAGFPSGAEHTQNAAPVQWVRIDSPGGASRTHERIRTQRRGGPAPAGYPRTKAATPAAASDRTRASASAPDNPPRTTRKGPVAAHAEPAEPLRRPVPAPPGRRPRAVLKAPGLHRHRPHRCASPAGAAVVARPARRWAASGPAAGARWPARGVDGGAAGDHDGGGGGAGRDGRQGAHHRRPRRRHDERSSSRAGTGESSALGEAARRRGRAAPATTTADDDGASDHGKPPGQASDRCHQCTRGGTLAACPCSIWPTPSSARPRRRSARLSVERLVAQQPDAATRLHEPALRGRRRGRHRRQPRAGPRWSRPTPPPSTCSTDLDRRPPVDAGRRRRPRPLEAARVPADRRPRPARPRRPHRHRRRPSRRWPPTCSTGAVGADGAAVGRPAGRHRHGQAGRRRAQLRQRHRRDVRRRGRPGGAGALGPPRRWTSPAAASGSTPTSGPRAATARSCARVASYEAYWSRWAEPWEFQALLKARAVAGDAELGAPVRRQRRPATCGTACSAPTTSARCAT